MSRRPPSNLLKQATGLQAYLKHPEGPPTGGGGPESPYKIKTRERSPSPNVRSLHHSMSSTSLRSEAASDITVAPGRRLWQLTEEEKQVSKELRDAMDARDEAQMTFGSLLYETPENRNAKELKDELEFIETMEKLIKKYAELQQRLKTQIAELERTSHLFEPFGEEVPRGGRSRRRSEEELEEPESRHALDLNRPSMEEIEGAREDHIGEVPESVGAWTRINRLRRGSTSSGSDRSSDSEDDNHRRGPRGRRFF